MRPAAVANYFGVTTKVQIRKFRRYDGLNRDRQREARKRARNRETLFLATLAHLEQFIGLREEMGEEELTACLDAQFVSSKRGEPTAIPYTGSAQWHAYKVDKYTGKHIGAGSEQQSECMQCEVCCGRLRPGRVCLGCYAVPATLNRKLSTLREDDTVRREAHETAKLAVIRKTLASRVKPRLSFAQRHHSG